MVPSQATIDEFTPNPDNPFQFGIGIGGAQIPGSTPGRDIFGLPLSPANRIRFNSFPEGFDANGPIGLSSGRGVPRPAASGFSVNLSPTIGAGPKRVDRILSGLPPDLADQFAAVLEDIGAGREAALAGRDAAIGTLQTAADRIPGDINSFLNDPNGLAILRALGDRATGVTPAVTADQRAFAINQLGQSFATNLAQVRNEAASRGQNPDDSALARSLRTNTEAAGLGLRANLDTLNTTARDRALASLGTFDQSRRQFVETLRNEGDRLAGAIADLQSGVVTQPIDFSAPGSLAFARENATTAADEATRALDIADRQSRADFFDFLQLGLSLGGTGIPRAVGGALSNVFGGSNN